MINEKEKFKYIKKSEKKLKKSHKTQSPMAINSIN